MSKSPEPCPDPELLPGAIALPPRWDLIFGRTAPLAVEIGSGGGRFILEEASRRPDWNFIAIERAGEYFRLLKARLLKRRLPNVRLLRTDGAEVVIHLLPARSVWAYHVYFPDPWPKKRHHKRRLFTAAFCAALRRTLAPEGRLYFATDHAAYLEEVLPRLRTELEMRSHPGPWEDAPAGRTNYEIKYLKEGRAIHRFTGRVPEE